MSPRTWKSRVQDIMACIKNIHSYTDGMSHNTFIDDPKTIWAVAFELIIIGEAARSIPAKIQERFTQIPWGKMQAIRNILVHEYFRVDE